MHIRVGLGTNFQLILTIFIFWVEIWCFQSKTENSLHLCVCAWSFLTILNFFALGPIDAKAFATRQDKGRLRRLLMKVNACKAHKTRVNDE